MMTKKNDKVNNELKDIDVVYELRKLTYGRPIDFVRNSRYGLSLKEQKVLAYAYVLARNFDKKGCIYPFDPKQYCEFFGVDVQSGVNKKDALEALVNLKKKLFFVPLGKVGENGKPLYISHSWIDQIIVDSEMTPIGFKLDEVVEETARSKSGNVDLLYLYVLLFKSKYSFRLYELLKTYEEIGTCEFDVDVLKELLLTETDENGNLIVCDKYKKYNDFKIYLIVRPLKEINKYTDLSIDYEFLPKDKKVKKKVVFHIKTKSSIECLKLQYENKNVLNLEEFKKIKPLDENQIPGQISFDDINMTLSP